MAGTVTSYESAHGRRWRVRYRRPDRSQAERRGFTTKNAAETYLASVTIAKATGTYINPAEGNITIGDLGPAWLHSKRNLKPSYTASLTRDWRVYVQPRWGSVPVSKVRRSDVSEWVQQLREGSAPTARDPSSRNQDGPRSASVVLRCLGILRGILAQAVDDRRIATNPAERVKGQPRRHSMKPRRYLTDAEIARLADEIRDDTQRTLVRFLAYTGLRWGEAAALRVRDINPLRRRVHVVRNAVEISGHVHLGTPKSWEQRTVPYPALLAEPLDQLIAGKGVDDLVFAGPFGGFLRRPTTAEDSTSWYREAIRRSGLERLTIHDLRHTAASLAIRSGANVKVIQRMLGHKSAAMTLDIYADLFDDDLDDVATRMNDAAQRAISRQVTATDGQ